MGDMNCTDIESAIRTVMGTARSMGIDVVEKTKEVMCALRTTTDSRELLHLADPVGGENEAERRRMPKIPKNRAKAGLVDRGAQVQRR
jgi:hypothetical protein